MPIWKTRSKHQLNKAVAIIFLVISLVGFSDATYLTILHYKGIAPKCSIIFGCAQVTGSQYAEIVGIPVALLGSIFYLIIFLASIIFLDIKKDKLLHYISYFTIAGFLASLYFIFLQLFVIHYICIYCMLSATTSTLLFMVAMVYLNTHKKAI